jgi:hypothetical protein
LRELTNAADYHPAVPSRTFILHVGTHKTGTSSLQTMLADNPGHFLDRGLYYPHSGRVGNGQHNLAWELSHDPRYRSQAGALDALVDELRRSRLHEVALVSSEDFETLYNRPKALAGLRLRLEDLGYSVRVLVTLRDPGDYLESLYAELLKHGLPEGDFDAFIANAVRQGGVVFRDWDFRLNYEPLVGGFAEVFGPGAVCVLAYDPSDALGPIFQVCQGFTGTSIPLVPGGRRVNVRDTEARFRYRLDPTQRRDIVDAFAEPMQTVFEAFGPSSRVAPLGWSATGPLSGTSPEAGAE